MYTPCAELHAQYVHRGQVEKVIKPYVSIHRVRVPRLYDLPALYVVWRDISGPVWNIRPAGKYRKGREKRKKEKEKKPHPVP